MPNFIEQPRFSCALGAQQSVVAIRRAVPIVHAGPGCSVKIQDIIGQGEGYAGGSTIPCTNASEREIVFGGESRLKEVIEGALKVIDGDLYVVLTGCTSDIVGDDVGQVVSRFQQEGKPLVFVETGGFKSNNYVSHDRVLTAIIEQFVAVKATDLEVEPGLVNVFASIPYQDPYWNGNLRELKRVLEGLGLKVNTLFGADSEGISEWLSVPKAQFNLVVSAWAGLETAVYLEKKYGTPYLHFPYLPIGGVETTKFLKEVAQFGHLDQDRAEGFIKREESIFYSYLERTADFMLEFRYGIPRIFHTLLDASYAVGISKYLLNELGILPGKQFVVDNTPDLYRGHIQEQFKNISKTRSAEVVFETDAGLIQEILKTERSSKRALILGSMWERDLAKELNADLLPLSVPIAHRLILNCGYAGYNGGLRVIEDLYDRVLDTYR